MIRLAVKVAAIPILLAGCQSLGGAEVGSSNPRDTTSNPRKATTGADGSLGDLFTNGVFASGENANTLPVNKYLWRGALDTLSFLPLASTDPFSGVIATEWGASPDAPNERVRVTAYVEGKELTARALDVSIFRETLGGSGAWVAAPVNPQTAEQMKDKILLRARELRIQDVDGPKV